MCNFFLIMQFWTVLVSVQYSYKSLIISSTARQSPRFLFCTQPKHCVCSFFLTAAYGWLVDHTVNFTSPVPLHLLMRERVWLAESSSSAHREQNSLGRVKQINNLHMKQSMDAGLSVFLYSLFHLMLFCLLIIVLSCLLVSCNSLHLVLTTLWTSHCYANVISSIYFSA